MSEMNDNSETRKARSAHQLFMLSLGLLLIVGPLMIFIEIGRIAILVPIALSMAFAFYTYYQSRHITNDFIRTHWYYAFQNYRWLFAGYLLSALLLFISWLVEANSAAHSPSQLLSVALIRIGIMPAIIMLFVSFVIGNNALNMAMQHKRPKSQEKQAS